MVFNSNQHYSKAIEEFKSFYSEILKEFTKLSELSTIMMYHSYQKEKAQLENSLGVFF